MSNLSSKSFNNSKYNLYLIIHMIKQQKMDQQSYGASEDFQHQEIMAKIQHVGIIAKNNEIKIKKKAVPVEKQQLYAENLSLRARVKELLDANIRMKTQLSIAEKQKLNICNIAEEEAFQPKLVPRSQSGNRGSINNLLPAQYQNAAFVLTNPLAKQKQNQAIKKMLRDFKMQIQKLKAQNSKLKKTMKYTRMNELLAQNKQLLDETIRMKAILAQAKEIQNQNYNQYVQQIENLRKRLAGQRQGEKKNGFELKKQLQIANDLKQKVKDIQIKKIQVQKRLNREIKILKSQVQDLKGKLCEFGTTKTKQCEREDCMKSKKEKNDFKKKQQALQKQNKKIKEQLQNERKKMITKQLEIKRLAQSNNKAPEIKKNNIIAQTEPLKEKHDIYSPKKEDNDVIQKGQTSSEVKQHKKQQSPKILNNQEEFNKNLHQNKLQIKQKTKNKDKEQSLKIESDKKEASIRKLNDSNNTEKLLESYDQYLNKQTKQVKESKIQNQSQGDYQALNYDQFEVEELVTKQQKNKNDEKNKKEKGIQQKQIKEKQAKSKQTQDKKKRKDEGKEVKQKTKKPKKQESDEEVLYKQQPKQQTQQTKKELKIIKETLLYKFLAQRYTFQDFSKDIKNSEINSFSIGQVMNILTEEPFLLDQPSIEAVLIYLFQTDQINGDESITAKNFVKKMKKFIGKAQPLEEALEEQYISKIGDIINKNENVGHKLTKKFSALAKKDGSVQKDDFIKVMSEFGLKGGALEFAIAQIVYVSPNIDQLNSQYFIKRFTHDDEQEQIL